MDAINRAWYSSGHAVSVFSADDRLEPTLALLFVLYRELIVGRDVLDIGVGPGRTTMYLSRLTPRYVGIDYSPTMVSSCSARFPDARIELADARDLARFPDSSFDFILFSYAGIDAIDHESRLMALREIRRVLRPEGAFVFGAHNRDYRDARSGPRIRFSRNPLTLAANVVRWASSVRNHLAVRRFETESEEYALINDAADGYRLLHYYISGRAQRQQLLQAGLRAETAFDARCHALEERDLAAHSPWIWYVTRRTPSA